ncbi:MAG: hypothetical protein IJJ23_03765 [Clostridia bacterium]|nr:hypothetical protein [Clostridia bacterium]
MTIEKYRIEPRKLMMAFAAKKLDMSKVSVQMGHDASFLSHCKQQGHIKKPDATLLKALTGIAPEDYAPDEPEPPKPEPVTATLDVKERMSLADRLSLDKASAAIEQLKHAVNDQRLQIRELTGVISRVADDMDKIVKLLDDPMKLYRTIFVPMYNGIRAVEKENEQKPERRIDGTLRQ